MKEVLSKIIGGILIAIVFVIVFAIGMVVGFAISTLTAMFVALPIWIVWGLIAPYGLVIGFWQWTGIVLIVRMLIGKGFRPEHENFKKGREYFNKQ